MKKIAVLSLLVIFLTSFAFAGTVDLPKTGQTKCYNSGETEIPEIPCAGTGQDGEIQAGVNWPSPRFKVSGDVVTDNLTGLMWTMNANLPGEMTWDEALVYCNNLTLGGYSDWRLPNVNELESLINANELSPADWLNTRGFNNVQAPHYWSSTTNVGYADNAWVVYMDQGGVYGSYKSYSNYVWPVRGGQQDLPDSTYPAYVWKTGQTTRYATGDDGDLEKGVAWPSPRFADHRNGTVTDNLTGLMWTKNANLLGDAMFWQQALDYVKGMNNGTYPNLGFTDWRLPNRKELHSLTDWSRYLPALPSGHPFTNVQCYYYWSSTTFADSTGAAWGVMMWYGYVNYCGKSYNPAYVWPVRGGQVDVSQYSISGNVTLSGSGLTGVTITLSGDSADSTTTDSSGNYSFTGLSNGTYTVTPSKSGYTFTPSSRAATISGANQTGVNFTASSTATYSISGTITLSSSGLNGVTVNLSGSGSGSTATDSSGNYSFTGLSNGTYTVTPSKSGYTFTPSSRAVTISGANQTGVDFTATTVPCDYTISPTSQSFSSNGGSGSVSVTTQSECIWTATSKASWITITSGNSGTGDGTVSYSVSVNTETSQRTGTMTIAGETFTVTQEGTSTTECSTWADVVAKYQAYKNGQATLRDVINCYREWKGNRMGR